MSALDRTLGILTHAGHRIAHFIRGGKPPPSERKSPYFWMNVVAGSGLAIMLLIGLVKTHFTIGIDMQEVKCLPGTVYLVRNQTLHVDEIQRGKIYSYESRGLMPLLPDGVLVAKIAAALPGDSVDVGKNGIYINGVKWGDLNPQVMKTTNLSIEDVTRSYVLGPDEILMLGTLPRSYDGRYWGPVSLDRFVGRSWRVF